MELLARLAEQLHGNELRGVQLEGVSSTSVLNDLLEIQRLIHGDGREPLDVYLRLSAFYAALGQHEQAVAVTQNLLDKQRKRLGDNHIEIAKLLRQLANSYERLSRTDEAEDARQQAMSIVAGLLGKPDVVAVLSDLIGDDLRGTTDGAAAAPEAFAGEGPEKVGKGVQQAVPKRGDIWWVQFPQYPNDPHQPRPAVVVSVDHRNARADKVQVVPLSSTNNGHRMNYAIPRANSGLQYDSCAKCGDITAVAKMMLQGHGPIGTVPKQVVDGIVELAQQALVQ
jgi:mRNA-degrading endonuclease toxin of MazEF toxin-antitoxin module